MVRIRQTGGVTIVQDPDTADANDMPNAAIGTGSVSWILWPELIADAVMDRLQTLDLGRFTGEFDDPFAATAIFGVTLVPAVCCVDNNDLPMPPPQSPVG